MTDLSITKIGRMSDDAIIQQIGEYVRFHRLDQNITQQDLATKAGINRTTLSDLELGRRCNLLTLIQVMRILNKLDLFQNFEVERRISPLLLAEMEMKYRKKAKKKNKKNPEQPNSDW